MELFVIIKSEGMEGEVGDHMPVVMPNTINKVAGKALLHECQEEYTRESLPQHLGVALNSRRNC